MCEGRKKVLVVEDNALLCEAIVDALGLGGYPAVGVANVEEALSYLSRTLPDILVIDYFLAGRTCNDLLQVLRRRSGAAGVTVIVMSGDEPALADLAVPILHKPFTLDDLLEAIEAPDQERIRH